MTNEELIDILLRAIPKTRERAEAVAPTYLDSLGADGSTAGGAAASPSHAAESTRDSVLANQLALLTREIAETQRTAQRGDSADRAQHESAEGNLFRTITGALAPDVTRGSAPFSKAIGLSPVLAGLKRLFGGGTGAEPVQALPIYIPPQSVNVAAGLDTSGALRAVSRGVADSPRPIAGREQPSTASVTIQVNAIDSRSFMDHSNEIAKAVREAMLSGHALNDVFME